MNRTEQNSFSQKGKVPKTKSIRSVALFDANSGTILHMHHVMTMDGCKPRDMEEIEKDAVRFTAFANKHYLQGEKIAKAISKKER